MCHDRRSNNRINDIHEKSLRAVYNDKKSTFEELLDKDNSVTIHQRNLQVLATELYKVKTNIAPEIVKDIFNTQDSTYNLRSGNSFRLGNINTVFYGQESITFLGPKIWALVPPEIKNSKSLNEFKNKIKTWSPKNCPCRLCKTFVRDVGFIN